MTHEYTTKSLERRLGEGGRRMMLSSAPNPRRTPLPAKDVNSRDTRRLQDGRKRQKLSHSPEEESHGQHQHQIAGSRLRVLPSQESSSSDQSASKWFKHANKDVTSAQQDQPELDNDPPFYMSNRPNNVPDNFAASDDDRRFGTHGTRSRLGSENEDLRGVIDDLTVENKRLRQMIRSQQKQHRNTPTSDSAQQDKLFEVRIHGLAVQKRRELENLLKTFATSVHSGADGLSKVTSNSIASASGTSSSQNIVPKSGSAAPHTDSGYASNTTSGDVSAHQTVQPAAPVRPKPTNRQAVKSYLQDIPDTLLPRYKPIMSEHAKQALVVRRLEQLFTGRQAGPGAHEQSVQQQEISHSAAQADRREDYQNNRKRKAEGRREARVLGPDSGINFDLMDAVAGKESPPRQSLGSDGFPVTRPGSPEQRPTRPLDLDIHRAQVAADNIKYIGHLGLGPAQSDEAAKCTDSSPWIFLNLLAGLAQLHTINVTPDFVRRAIKKRSNAFELSKDGNMVRWVGGLNSTSFSFEDEKAIETATLERQESSEDIGTSGSNSRRSRSDNTSGAAYTSLTPSEDKTSGLQISSDSRQLPTTISATSNLPTLSSITKPNTGSAFDYKPIVYREKTKLYDHLPDSDDSFDSQSGDSSGLVHALSKSSIDKQVKDEGHITFYNNPYFCSDLSADLEPSNMRSTRVAAASCDILGVPAPVDEVESPLRSCDATYFTTQFAPMPFYPDKLSDGDKAKFLASLPRIPDLLPISEAGETETMPLEFDVCGLGGVTPAENFAIDVKTQMRPTPTRAEGAVIRQLPFSRRTYLQKYMTQIESCDKIDLLPSRLPPPSYIFFTSSSSSDGTDMMDDDDDASSASSSPFVDEEFPAPPAFLQRFSRSSHENLGDDEDDESSDIDMLAMARKLNPDGVAEQERQYMLLQPGGARRAVDGSLAATVGASGSASSSVRGDAFATSAVSEEMDDDEDVHT